MGHGTADLFKSLLKTMRDSVDVRIWEEYLTFETPHMNLYGGEEPPPDFVNVPESRELSRVGVYLASSSTGFSEIKHQVLQRRRRAS